MTTLRGSAMLIAMLFAGTGGSAFAQDAKADMDAAATTHGNLDLTAAASFYDEVCSNCHGPTAKGMASFPKLAGQEVDYLSMRLHQYKAGEKVGYNTGLMAPVAMDLSDDEIAALSEYIASEFQ